MEIHISFTYFCFYFNQTRWDIGKRMWLFKKSFGCCRHSTKNQAADPKTMQDRKNCEKMFESAINALVTQRLAHPISNRVVVGLSLTRDAFFVRSLFPNFMNIHCPCPPKQRQKSLFQAQKRWIEINSVCDSNNHIIFLRF